MQLEILKKNIGVGFNLYKRGKKYNVGGELIKFLLQFFLIFHIKN